MRAAPDERRKGRGGGPSGSPISGPVGSRVSGLADAELAGLCRAAFLGSRSVVLAVSGGLDSMTLLLAAQRWREAEQGAGREIALHVATIDHGLRPASADEAQWVAQQAQKASIAHHILVWTGEKPRTRIQEAARTARFGLLVDLVRRLRLPQRADIALAHHLDDQAETFIMRLARGSGVDGLAAMPGRRKLNPFPEEIHIVRPLLGISKERLRATLLERGLAWLEDPSNESLAFERVRVRRLLPALAQAGVGAEQIGAAARRLARAKEALEQATADLVERIVDFHHGAMAEIALAGFLAAPAEFRVRLLQRIMGRFGGGRDEAARLTQIEKLADELASGDRVATLAGCRVARAEGRIQVVREPGRKGLPELILPPGGALVWDNRFIVSASADFPGPLLVKTMPAQVWALIGASRRGARLPGPAIPRAAALTLPSFWDGDRLIAVPHPQIAVGAGIGVSALFLPA